MKIIKFNVDGETRDITPSQQMSKDAMLDLALSESNEKGISAVLVSSGDSWGFFQKGKVLIQSVNF